MQSFSDLKNRVLISTATILIAAVLIFFSYLAVLQFVIVLCIVGLAILSVFEYASFVKTKQVNLPVWLLSILAVAFIFANYLTVLLNLPFLAGGVIAAFFFAIFIYHFYRVDGAILRLATAFFCGMYIIVPLGLMLRILYPDNTSSIFHDGRLWLTYLIAVTKITDIGAYFIGRLFGKSKLAPHLSPGKTLAGAVAGFFSAIAMSLIFHWISHFCPPKLFFLSLGQSVILGGIIGIFGQLGDLAESLLKRDAQMKDSNQIPGLGGALDLLDSLFFTIPILYLFLRMGPA